MLANIFFDVVSSVVILCLLPLTLAIRGSVERAERKKAEYDECLRMYEERLQRRIRESLDSADRLYVHTQEKEPEPRVEPVPKTQKALNCPNCGAYIPELIGHCVACSKPEQANGYPSSDVIDRLCDDAESNRINMICSSNDIFHDRGTSHGTLYCYDTHELYEWQPSRREWLSVYKG